MPGEGATAPGSPFPREIWGSADSAFGGYLEGVVNSHPNSWVKGFALGNLVSGQKDGAWGSQEAALKPSEVFGGSPGCPGWSGAAAAPAVALVRAPPGLPRVRSGAWRPELAHAESAGPGCP